MPWIRSTFPTRARVSPTALRRDYSPCRATVEEMEVPEKRESPAYPTATRLPPADLWRRTVSRGHRGARLRPLLAERWQQQQQQQFI